VLLTSFDKIPVKDILIVTGAIGSPGSPADMKNLPGGVIKWQGKASPESRKEAVWIDIDSGEGSVAPDGFKCCAVQVTAWLASEASAAAKRWASITKGAPIKFSGKIAAIDRGSFAALRTHFVRIYVEEFAISE
jgi:hypothetical protein